MVELSHLDPAGEGGLEAQRRWIQGRARHPRFAGQLEPADARGFARNPSCGDTVAVSLRFSTPPDQVQAIRCAVRGCVLCNLMAILARLPARARCVLLTWQALLQVLKLEQARDGERAVSG